MLECHSSFYRPFLSPHTSHRQFALSIICNSITVAQALHDILAPPPLIHGTSWLSLCLFMSATRTACAILLISYDRLNVAWMRVKKFFHAFVLTSFMRCMKWIEGRWTTKPNILNQQRMVSVSLSPSPSVHACCHMYIKYLTIIAVLCTIRLWLCSQHIPHFIPSTI